MLLTRNINLTSSGNSVKTLSLVSFFIDRVNSDNGITESERCLNKKVRRYF